MSTTGLAGTVPWAWLAECRECGEAHEHRQVTCTCQGHRTTWAGDDGHTYVPRVSRYQLTALMAEHRTDTTTMKETT